MTTVNAWASPRDEFPDSVRTLMSLWGGFVTSPVNDDLGLEKRLEIDFANEILPCPEPNAAVPLNVLQLANIVSAELDEDCNKYEIQSNTFTITFRQCLLIRSTQKLIITSVPTVMLHRLIQPLLNLLREYDIEVEWASYFRKNISSPWSTDNSLCDFMAQEYADLKTAFPKGESFLTGPVDGDHFYHFVFDQVQRGGQRMECDAQLNLFMFDVEADELTSKPDMIGEESFAHCDCCKSVTGKETNNKESNNTNIINDMARFAQMRNVKSSFTTNCDEVCKMDSLLKDQQYIVLNADGTYEMLRCCASLPNVSYENNCATNAMQWQRMSALIAKYKPARFTVVVLQDRDVRCTEIRHYINNFEHYHLQSRVVNEFAYGYAFHQMLFTRET